MNESILIIEEMITELKNVEDAETYTERYDRINSLEEAIRRIKSVIIVSEFEQTVISDYSVRAEKGHYISSGCNQIAIYDFIDNKFFKSFDIDANYWKLSEAEIERILIKYGFIKLVSEK
ncbi:hypothetical protein [Clostridium estertheticum]|uniref:hypothetical protein n=1 Tax=Clostridium estertheticum TaxID=238834 RepID=UPI001C0AB918|nr:hypothetical protein [Clostridium estertheticum]MBU3186618.1 hypothetical protein [Clostridium estertheticum]